MDDHHSRLIYGPLHQGRIDLCILKPEQLDDEVGRFSESDEYNFNYKAVVWVELENRSPKKEDLKLQHM
jgi:hypothetical protein